MTVRIIVGDVRQRMAELPADSVQCVVTSPPYFGLRDYGTGIWTGGDPDCQHPPQVDPELSNRTSTLEGGKKTQTAAKVDTRDICHICGAFRTDLQIGREPTMLEFVDAIVQVFREVRRVLRPDGVAWLNLGDTYSDSSNRSSIPGKNLMMVPARVAIALVDDGWYLRSDIIWHKPNPMPESVRDRPTSSHEHIFMLTRSARYYYDPDPIREPFAATSVPRLAQDIAAQNGSTRAYGGTDDEPMRAVAKRMPLNGAYTPPGQSPHMGALRQGRKHGFKGATDVECDNMPAVEYPPIGESTRVARSHDRDSVQDSAEPMSVMLGPNCRNVWSIGTAPYSGAHFAVFPPEIPRRCILASTSEVGQCRTCGSPWKRSTSHGELSGERKIQTGDRPAADARNVSPSSLLRTDGRTMRSTVVGNWEPTCSCEDCEPVPQVVLDPFAGAGTTLLVADRLGRHGIGIELNPEFADLATARLTSDAPLFVDAEPIGETDDVQLSFV